MSVTIKEIRERKPSAFGFSVSTIGGEKDGEEFRMVEALMSDNTVRSVFVSNSRNGVFRQVFVPWNFKHRKIAE